MEAWDCGVIIPDQRNSMPLWFQTFTFVLPKKEGICIKQFLYRRFTFTQKHVRTNVPLDFRVDRDLSRLAVHLKYSPKIISDPEILLPQIEKCMESYRPPEYRLTQEEIKKYHHLMNFVTLSVDKNGEYIGCAHRHSPEQIIFLSEGGSSYGFLPVAASAGDWRLVLHIHAVVVGTVDYQVAVYGLEGGESDDTIPAF